MLKLESIRRDWKQSGSFPAHLNLFSFWDETSFLTKYVYAESFVVFAPLEASSNQFQTLNLNRVDGFCLEGTMGDLGRRWGTYDNCAAEIDTEEAKIAC